MKTKDEMLESLTEFLVEYFEGDEEDTTIEDYDLEVMADDIWEHIEKQLVSETKDKPEYKIGDIVFVKANNYHDYKENEQVVITEGKDRYDRYTIESIDRPRLTQVIKDEHIKGLLESAKKEGEFKIGDHVVVIGNRAGHRFEIGEEIELIRKPDYFFNANSLERMGVNYDVLIEDIKHIE